MNPLDELKSIERQIDQVTDLAGLKPIFFRLEAIAKENAHDFDVQLTVGDLKQHLVNRGTKLKDAMEAKPATPAAPATPTPPASPATVVRPPEASPVPGWAATPLTGIIDAPSPLSKPGPQGPPLPPPPSPAATESATIPPPKPQATPKSATELPRTTEPASPAGVSENQTTGAIPPVAPASSLRGKVGDPPQKTGNRNAVLIGALVALLLIVGAGIAFREHRQKAAVQVQIATTPAGASVRVNGTPQCTSNCSVGLTPGSYQITAFLDGYEPAAGTVQVNPSQPTTLNLALEPQAQSLRILTDLDQGKVTIDDQPPADLQEGQFIVDRVATGMHTVKIVGKGGEVSFSFEVADAKLPSIAGPVAAKNLNALLVASLANQAHVVTNSGPLKLSVNGQPEADATPDGVDLKTFQAGVDELTIGDGKDEVSVKESFGPAPMLTAFLRSGVSTGTLIVATGEDGVRVFVNNKEFARRTQRGQVRIQTVGSVSVRVAKEGFDPPQAQTAEVKKGAETRMEFKLKAAPQFSTLLVVGGTPGAEVLIDQRSVGTVGPDGGFTSAGVAPGDHVVEIRRDQYISHTLPRTFRAGLTVTIVGGDAILSAAPPPPPAPPPPTPKAEPPPVVAVQKAAPPAPKAGTMEDWEDPAAWKSKDGGWSHQGAGFIPYNLPANGVFTFTVQLVKGGSIIRGGKIRWCVNYTDKQNYALYEMDNKNFWAKVVVKGKTFERTHTQLKDLEKQKSFTIQIDVTPEHVVHKMFAGGEWVNLDSWAETGRNFSEGKFGFLIQGNDEIGLADFKFQPK